MQVGTSLIIYIDAGCDTVLIKGLEPNCVLSKEPSDCFVSAVEDSILTVSDPAMETEVFEKFPKFETLCRILSEKLLAKEQISFDEFKFLTV